ncbi:MAG: GNAT family N-acetyltransferase [Microthrixaceae bacterium]
MTDGAVNDRTGDAGVRIEECTTADDELVTAMARLVPQLSSSSPPPDLDRLAAIVGNEACHLLIARDEGDGTILGSMTLVVFPIPTGIRAWIEDVVVDGAARGRGVGELLNREALALAQRLGARTVDLTSRPSREAANRLYRRIGFEQRETNVYRYRSDN